MKKIYSIFSLLSIFISGSSQVNLTQGLYGCYSFSANALDQSGNSHDGIINGATLGPDRFGNPNSAYQFNNGSYIEIPTLNLLGSKSEFSISFWAKADALSGFAMILYPDNPSDRLAVSLYYGHNGTSSIFWDYGSIYTTGRMYVLPYPLVSNWEHYVFTSSVINNRMSIYKNGVLLTSEAHSASLSDINRSLRIGGNGDPGYTFHGSIDDIRIYNREINSSEITQLAALTTACTTNTGVNETSTNQVFVYPNPANDFFTIASNGLISKDITIVDAIGNTMYSSVSSGNEISINTTDWPNGVYFVEVNSENKPSIRTKIVKQ